MILSLDILFHWHYVVNLLLAIKNLFHIISTFYITVKCQSIHIQLSYTIEEEPGFFSTHFTWTFFFFSCDVVFLHRIPLFSIFLFFHNVLDMRSFHYVVL